MNLPIFDETFERFKNTEFPKNYTPVYLGRMNESSSLGRYAMAITHDNMPLIVDSFQVNPLLKSDFDFSSSASLSKNLPDDKPLAYEFTTIYKLQEPIAAYQAEYYFFNIWGQPACGKSFEYIDDFTDQYLTIKRTLAYEFFELLNNYLIGSVGTKVQRAT